MTALCVIGTEASAKFQNVLILAQVVSLLIFAVVALYRATTGDSPLEAITPSISWLNPFAEGGAALTAGLLLGVFTYWGWESAVNLTEETTDSESTPGKAAIVSTVVLLVTYIAVAYAVVAFAGTTFLADNAGEEESIFALLGEQVLGGWDWVLLLRWPRRRWPPPRPRSSRPPGPACRWRGAPRCRTGWPTSTRDSAPRTSPPGRSPAIAIGWYVLINIISENALFDSLTALSLLIAFYYSLTGIACAVYYRKQLLRSATNLLLIGVGPVIGSILLIWLLIRSIIDLNDPESSSTGVAWFGFGPPLVIGVGIFLVGIAVHDLLADPATRGSGRSGRGGPGPGDGRSAPGDPATGGPLS